jgi:hypothetical protein
MRGVSPASREPAIPDFVLRFWPGRPVWLNAVTVAALVWFVTFCIVTFLAVTGRISTVSYAVYKAAGARWLAGEPLYETETIEGFQYLPQSAMLLAPFAWIGSPAGDIAWRALWVLVCSTGIWRVGAQLVPKRPGDSFFLASCLAVGLAVGPLGNGQANLALAGIVLHVTADLIARRFSRAAIVLTFGVALKPHLLVFVLLVAALYRPMTWRLAVGLFLMLLIPWLFSDH